MKNLVTAELFYFSKRERRGILLILFINASLLFLPGMIVTKQDATIDASAPRPTFQKSSDTGGENHQSQISGASSEQDISASTAPFYFDPNTLDSQGWVKLGLPIKTIHTMLNYRAKGGKFYYPEDLEKIWGMSPEMAARLIPYVTIPPIDKKQQATYNYEKKEKRGPIYLNLNQADSMAFESLPGIGPVLAGRMIAYRKKLGGFFSVNQLKEVWGLRDSVYQKVADRLYVNPDQVQKIDINTATWELLCKHPYIGYSLAKTIIRYKNQHGNFKSLKDIQHILLIDEITYNKIEHYFTVTAEN